MEISVTEVRFEHDQMWLTLSDGRILGVPLAWFPRLRRATAAERDGWEIGLFGVHWEELDEDVSLAGLLAGRADRRVAVGV